MVSRYLAFGEEKEKLVATNPFLVRGKLIKNDSDREGIVSDKKKTASEGEMNFAGLGICSFAHRSFAHSLILLKSKERL